MNGGGDKRLDLFFSFEFADRYSSSTAEKLGLARTNSKIGSKTTVASIGLLSNSDLE